MNTARQIRNLMESVEKAMECPIGEHITGDENQLRFKCKGQDFGGWIEIRGQGEVDVVVVHGSDYKVTKGIDSSDIGAMAKAARDAALKLLDGDSDGQVKNDDEIEEDMLLPIDSKEPEDKDDDQLDELDLDDEVDEGLAQHVARHVAVGAMAGSSSGTSAMVKGAALGAGIGLAKFAYDKYSEKKKKKVSVKESKSDKDVENLIKAVTADGGMQFMKDEFDENGYPVVYFESESGLTKARVTITENGYIFTTYSRRQPTHDNAEVGSLPALSSHLSYLAYNE